MSDNSLPLLRPVPQRAFQITPSSTEPSTPPTPDHDKDPTHLDARSKGGLSSRNRSILNLTSSTLFGIYAPTENEVSRDDPLSTPWRPGSMTPQRSYYRTIDADDRKPAMIGAFERPQQREVPAHHQPQPKLIDTLLATIFRSVLLFVFGMAYGMIVTHLHDEQGLAPVKVEGIRRDTWRYLLFWGVAGVALGRLLPWVDVLWEEALAAGQEGGSGESSGETLKTNGSADNKSERLRASSESGLGADWNPIVRSIGAFVGIAFAIRRLPWTSTLQVSLTLALVNPVLWYLIDRSKPGFLLSAVIGIFGTSVLLGINPEMVPSPATPSPPANGSNMPSESMMPLRFMSPEIIGVWTWVASVLFCSCVCFGNIGRRLALGKTDKGKS